MTKTNDLEFLCALAEFRLATTPILAARMGTSEQMIRRRCRRLTDSGDLMVIPSPPGHGRGRPECVFSPALRGGNRLVSEGLIPKHIPPDQVTGEALFKMAQHQVLLNWMAIHMARLEQPGGQLEVTFLSSTSPFHLSTGGGTILRDQVEFSDGTRLPFTPDDAICFTNNVLHKSLLFFLEVDMGTETLTDPKHSRNAGIRRKIIV